VKRRVANQFEIFPAHSYYPQDHFKPAHYPPAGMSGFKPP